MHVFSHDGLSSFSTCEPAHTLPHTGSCQVFGSSNEKIHKTVSVSILMGQALINTPEVSRMLHKQPLILPGVTCFQILGLPL